MSSVSTHASPPARTFARIRSAIASSSRTFKGAAVCAALIVFVAIAAPFLAPHNPYTTNYALSLAAPSPEHWFGCDQMGRDVFSRVIYGTRTSVIVTLGTVVATSVLGIAVGFAVAWRGGWIDTVLMRIADMFQSFPELVLGVAIVGVLGQGIVNAVIAVIVVAWIRYARLTRSLVLRAKTDGYVATARMNGCTGLQIAIRHILPNVAPQVLAMAVLDIGFVLLTLASFSFLGLGVQAPEAEWGSMLNDARVYFARAPYLMVFPGCALFATVLVFNVLGNNIGSRIGERKL